MRNNQRNQVCPSNHLFHLLKKQTLARLQRFMLLACEALFTKGQL